jgi:hypothetical protein
MCAAAQQSAWHKLAEKLWPTAYAAGRVKGDGPFALLILCDQRAVLFDTAEKRQRAMVRLDYGCGAANCTTAHRYFDLPEQP